jgi:hypothetical protein
MIQIQTKIISFIIIFFLSLNNLFSFATKIDVKKPYESLYHDECSCVKMKTENASLRKHCIDSQKKCADILSTEIVKIPSCHGDKGSRDNDVKTKYSNDSSGIVSSIMGAIGNNKWISEKIGAVQNATGKGLETKYVMTYIEAIVNIGTFLLDVVTGDSECFKYAFLKEIFRIIWERQDLDVMLETINDAKKCWIKFHTKLMKEKSNLDKIYNQIYPDNPHDEPDLKDRLYNPLNELYRVQETRKLRQIRRKIDKANDEYSIETFYDIKQLLFNDIKKTTYEFLEIVAETSRYNDSKTIDKELRKFKKRERVANGCEIIGQEVLETTILDAKKCTFYLKEKYKEVDEKIQNFYDGVKDFVKIIDKQLQIQEKIENIINDNKKSIVKIRTRCEKNVEGYYKSVNKIITKYERDLEKENNKTKLLKTEETIDNKMAETSRGPEEYKSNFLEKIPKELKEEKDKFKEEIKKIYSREIKRALKVNQDSIGDIKEISNKYFDNRGLGSARYRHIIQDIGVLEKINEERNFSNGTFLCMDNEKKEITFRAFSEAEKIDLCNPET